MLYSEFIKNRKINVPVPTKIVDSTESLRISVENAVSGDVIGVAAGRYNVSNPKIIFRNKKNVVLRSVSGDFRDVTFEGSGFHKKDGYGKTYTDELITITDESRDIVIHGITFAESTCHGVKIAGEGNVGYIIIDGCKFMNINERMIKGSKGDKGYRVPGMVITNNQFENTKIPKESDHIEQFRGNYIGGVDMMILDDAIISGNTFKNIKGAHNAARGAIFLWVQSKNLTAERNIIINCNNGICFGNPHNGSDSNELHVNGGLIANNMIIEASEQAVELAWVSNIKIFNNAIYQENINARGIRNSAPVESQKIYLDGNIVHAAIDIPYGVFTIDV